MIQLMVRKPLADLNNLPDKKGDSKKEEKVEVKEEKVKVAKVAESKVYKVGDGIDVRDRETGGKEYLDILLIRLCIILILIRGMVRGSNSEDNDW